MKKIILMAAVAMAAVAVNAAACSWTISGSAAASIKNGSSVWTTLAADGSAAAYLLLASDAGSVQAALDAGTFTGADTVASVKDFNARGRFSGAAIDIDATTQAYQMVLVYTDATTGNVNYQFASTSVNASGSDDSMTPAVAAQFGATQFSATGWTEVAAIPEPTSGLLLLLGVAGLALRRRRA